MRGGTDPDNPFDLSAASPHAIDVLKLYSLSGLKVPPTIEASRGSTIPILLCHGLTPFYKPGVEPTGVWGMGYTATLKDVDAATVAVFPESKLLKVAQSRQELQFGLTAGGKIGVPDEGLALANQIPGVTMTGAELHATTNQEFGLAIRCSFSVLEVQAGPVGAGGARWNIYRTSERIDVFQPLFQTLLIPRGVERLCISVEMWVRRPFRFLAWTKVRQWLYPPVTFDVSL
jgi:hypothetical protein